MRALGSALAALGIAPRTLGALLASRAGLRAALGLMPLLLAASWSGERFDEYTAAVAPFVLVGPLLAGGIEKSLLKVLARSDDDPQSAVAIYLALSAGAVALLLPWALATSIVSAHPVLTMTAFTFAAGLALSQLAADIHRVLGHAWVEVASQAVLAGCVSAVLAWVLLLEPGPSEVLQVLATVTATASLALLLPLLRRSGTARVRPGSAGAAVRDIALQGGPDVLAGVTITVLLLLAGALESDRARSDLYLALGVATVVTAGYSYLMRLAQPTVARRPVIGPGPGRGRARLAHRRAWIVVAACGAAYLGAVLAGGRVAAAWLGESRSAIAAVAVLLLHMPLLAAAAGLHFLHENAGPGELRATVVAAAVGTVCALVLAPPLIRFAGATGALTTLAVGELVHVCILLARDPVVARRHPAVLP